VDRQESETGLAELLFNLANSDRLKLLSEVASGGQRMSTLTKAIGASFPECSRHLARLSGAGLVRKGPGGNYELTEAGKLVMKLLPGIEFVLEHQGFFTSHDLSFLPDGFTERIGALATGEYVGHISLVLDHIKTVVSEARDHVWLISDRLFPQWPGIGSWWSSDEILVRVVSAQTVDPRVVSEYRSKLARCEIGTLKDVSVAMAINESVAGVVFPTLEGVIDFGAGFAGKDPVFRAWCNDLFEYYWSKAKRFHAPSPFSKS